jgi:hypothetical protein
MLTLVHTHKKTIFTLGFEIPPIIVYLSDTAPKNQLSVVGLLRDWQKYHFCPTNLQTIGMKYRRFLAFYVTEKVTKSL